MKILKVKTKPPYYITISNGLLEQIPEEIARKFEFGKIALITDSRVKELYGEVFLRALRKAGLRVELFYFPEGESSKRIETVIYLAREMLKNSFDRKDLIIALGGGVVGDVAGFLASIYLRGIPFIQIPTTLLAQVDSSIGGKTGVDLPEGKNLIGTFYQPRAVYIDTDVLRSLPHEELKNGLAEVVKYGCILKRRLFSYLYKRAPFLFSVEARDYEYIIYQSCLTKATIVQKDEKETGLRRVLNFGHTIGHALESISGYRVPHGLAVAVGMAVEAKLSELLKVNEEPLSDPLVQLLSKLELPFRISQLNIDFEPKQLLSFIARDKKVWKGKLTIVLLRKIGKFCLYENPPENKILEAIKQSL